MIHFLEEMGKKIDWFPLRQTHATTRTLSSGGHMHSHTWLSDKLMESYTQPPESQKPLCPRADTSIKGSITLFGDPYHPSPEGVYKLWLLRSGPHDSVKQCLQGNLPS